MWNTTTNLKNKGKLENLNLLKISDGKNKHTEPTQEILKIGGLLWLAKSVLSRQTSARDITTCFCVCFFIHAVTFHSREHPVFSSLVSPDFIFRRERSDDRKYVCGSHVMSPFNWWTLKLSTKANKHFHIPIGGQRRGRWRAIWSLPPPPPLYFCCDMIILRNWKLRSCSRSWPLENNVLTFLGTSAAGDSMSSQIGQPPDIFNLSN